LGPWSIVENKFQWPFSIILITLIGKEVHDEHRSIWAYVESWYQERENDMGERLGNSVLIVDDTEANIDVLVESLGEEYDVRVAMSGQSALDQVEQEAPDIILLDIMMPGMDGYEVCRRLKEKEQTRAIPIIFLTAMTESQNEKRGLDLGAVDYIIKPFNPGLVKARVRNHLELKRYRDHLEELVAKRTEEKMLIIHTFGMIVDPIVRDRMIEGKIELGGETRDTTVLFMDIRGFTSFSQAMTPRELLLFMKEYFDVTGEVIKAQGGTIIEYVGDGTMALFGAPLPIEDHALKACAAALLMQQTLEKQRKIWQEQGKPIINSGIGIHTGSMLVGNIGSSERYKYGAIGDSVNMGSRLQELTKVYGVPIITSEHTISQVKTSFHVRELDCVNMRGRTSEIKIYEIMGFRDQALPEDKIMLIEAYEEALRHYYSKDNRRALELFKKCLELLPGDKPSQILSSRLESS